MQIAHNMIVDAPPVFKLSAAAIYILRVLVLFMYRPLAGDSAAKSVRPGFVRLQDYHPRLPQAVCDSTSKLLFGGSLVGVLFSLLDQSRLLQKMA